MPPLLIRSFAAALSTGWMARRMASISVGEADGDLARLDRAHDLGRRVLQDALGAAHGPLANVQQRGSLGLRQGRQICRPVVSSLAIVEVGDLRGDQGAAGFVEMTPREVHRHHEAYRIVAS